MADGIRTDEREARAAIAGYPHWYHRIEVAPGVVTPGINDTQLTLEKLDLADDMHGTSVLDIGTRDGFFAFECERRGADVVAVDYMAATATGFAIAAKLIGSDVTYRQENVYKLVPEDVGTFDVVLMLGLLYHLPDLVGALRVVRRLCRRDLYLETHVCDLQYPQLADQPFALFCQGTSLNADPTNFWAPTTRCVEALLEECGFAVTKTIRVGMRSVFHAKVESGQPDRTDYHLAIALGDQLPK